MLSNVERDDTLRVLRIHALAGDMPHAEEESMDGRPAGVSSGNFEGELLVTNSPANVETTEKGVEYLDFNVQGAVAVRGVEIGAGGHTGGEVFGEAAFAAEGEEKLEGGCGERWKQDVER